MTAQGWAWVEHLRSGGTTPWSEWQAGRTTTTSVPLAPEPQPPQPLRPPQPPLPGAQQLETLRRLNLAAQTQAQGQAQAHGRRLTTARAEAVLSADMPGRGLPDLDLVGTGGAGYGFQPVDPGALPPSELLRVVVWLITRELHQAATSRGTAPTQNSSEPRRKPRRWRRRYRLFGDPLLVDPARRYLIDSGRAPRGGGPVYVVGADLATMLGDAWINRCFTDLTVDWPRWVARWHRRDQLPRRIDLAAISRKWQRRPLSGLARRIGDQERIIIVLDPNALPGLLHAPRLPAAPRPSAVAAELARRIHPLFALLPPLPQPTSGVLTGLLLPQLLALDADPRFAPACPEPGPHVPGPHVPGPYRQWVRRRARAMQEQLSAAGYPVYGDLATLVPPRRPAPSSTPTSGAIDEAATLELALRVLIERWTGGWADQQPAREVER